MLYVAAHFMAPKVTGSAAYPVDLEKSLGDSNRAGTEDSVPRTISPAAWEFPSIIFRSHPLSPYPYPLSELIVVTRHATIQIRRAVVMISFASSPTKPKIASAKLSLLLLQAPVATRSSAPEPTRWDAAAAIPGPAATNNAAAVDLVSMCSCGGALPRTEGRNRRSSSREHEAVPVHHG